MFNLYHHQWFLINKSIDSILMIVMIRILHTWLLVKRRTLSCLRGLSIIFTLSVIIVCVGDSFEFRHTGAYSFYVIDINKCFQAKQVRCAPLFIFILAFLYDKECPVDFWKKIIGYFSLYGYFCWNRDTSQWV